MAFVTGPIVPLPTLILSTERMGVISAAVPVKNKASLELGPAVPLFRTRLVVQGSESNGLPTTYDVTPDGQRFLLRYPPADPEPPMPWIHAPVKTPESRLVTFWVRVTPPTVCVGPV